MLSKWAFLIAATVLVAPSFAAATKSNFQISALPHLAANAMQVESAACSPTSLSVSEMETWLRGRSVNERAAALSALFTPHESGAPGHKKIENCGENALCSADAVWGALGLKLIYLKIRYGFNASEYAYANVDRFNEEELDDVLLSLASAPTEWFPLFSEVQLSRFRRGKILTTATREGFDVIANSEIYLFDSWEKLARGLRRYYVYHEVAHLVAERENDLDLSQTWRVVLENDQKSPRSCWISGYAEFDRREFFAEAVSAYRFNPDALKECPTTRTFLREKIYRGRVYESGKLFCDASIPPIDV